jgi:hypothetical protein
MTNRQWYMMYIDTLYIMLSSKLHDPETTPGALHVAGVGHVGDMH